MGFLGRLFGGRKDEGDKDKEKGGSATQQPESPEGQSSGKEKQVDPWNASVPTEGSQEFWDRKIEEIHGGDNPYKKGAEGDSTPQGGGENKG